MRHPGLILALLLAGPAAFAAGDQPRPAGCAPSPAASAADRHEDAAPAPEDDGDRVEAVEAEAVEAEPLADAAEPSFDSGDETPDWEAIDWDGMVASDPLRFLQLLQRKCNATLKDFTGRFYKRERIDGNLRDAEIAHMKWRADPFSVYMRFIKGDKGREAIYVEGQRDGKVLVHLGGLLGRLIKVEVEPDSKRALKDNLRPITGAGLPNMLNAAVPVFEQAADNGDLTIEYIGKAKIGGRPAYQIKRLLPEKEIYPAREFVLFIDVQALVPVGADSYDWDGQLLSRYRYTEFELNVGLTDKDFDPDNKDYDF